MRQGSLSVCLGVCFLVPETFQLSTAISSSASELEKEIGKKESYRVERRTKEGDETYGWRAESGEGTTQYTNNNTAPTGGGCDQRFEIVGTRLN